jgi:hypothetical protein
MRLLILLVCATSLYGQQDVGEPATQTVLRLERPLADLAHRWINDTIPQKQARGAILSIRVSENELPNAELISALGNPHSLADIGSTGRHAETADEHRVYLAVLEALIERGGTIPDELGLVLFPQYPAQAMILLYRRGCPKPATSIQLMRTAIADEVWLIAAECLAQQPGGPVELLRNTSVKAQIEVFDQEREVLPYGTPGGTLGGVISSDFGGWPRTATYRLAIDQEARPGHVLLRGGPHPVYYLREFLEPNWRESDCAWHRGDRNQYALDILARLVWRYGRVLDPVSTLRVHWMNPEQVRADLDFSAAQLNQRYADLLLGLIRRNLLTPAERTRCPQSVEIEVLDHRLDRTQPLPTITAK